MKSTAERTVEALTWAAVVIWLGFALVTHILGYAWLVVMVLGFILLASAIYQRSQGWHTSLSIWVFGIWMAVFSVLEIISTLIEATGGPGLNIDLWVYLGVALLSMGVAVIFRMVNPNALLGDSGSRRRGERYTDDPRPYVPRHVVEESSAAYLPPSRGRGRGAQRRPDYDYQQPARAADQADDYTYATRRDPRTPRPSYSAPDYPPSRQEPPRRAARDRYAPQDYDYGAEEQVPLLRTTAAMRPKTKPPASRPATRRAAAPPCPVAPTTVAVPGARVADRRARGTRPPIYRRA
ncbi:MAG: hypothetical protein KatS3mg051_0639 [Anaerolineae bacterium]|nr:MAG: hypothetical protein KatS3mg051_0639 [Anaerolineae bacterium]